MQRSVNRGDVRKISCSLEKRQMDWFSEFQKKDCEHGGDNLIINAYCGLSTDPTVTEF